MKTAILAFAAALAAAAAAAVSVYECPGLAPGPSDARPELPQPVPAVPSPDGTLVVAETNLTWSFDAACFVAAVDLSSVTCALPREAAERYNGPARKKVAAWIREGTASGNAGDFYFNRDGGHSRPVATNFPGLVSVAMDEKARGLGLDRLTPNVRLPRPVFGNASLSMTQGFMWRSAGRLHLTDQALASRMQFFYAGNEFWVFPAVDDFSTVPTNSFDRIPAASPFQLLAEGRSWSDRPYLQAAFAASAAMRPDTKEAVIRRHLLAPTLQWLFRRSRPGVETDEDYLTSKAHPTAFGKKDLDVDALVERVHALRPSDIPPAAALTLVNSPMFPVKYPKPEVDYPDIGAEFLTVTPFSVAMVLRDAQARRTVLVKASPFPRDAGEVSFKWVVVHGNPDAVRIEPPMGELPHVLGRGLAQITVDRRMIPPGGRIDVACFAKLPGTQYGAPSFVSFSAVALERREWREDGKIASIDYTNPDNLYCDPAVALPRRWRDVYEYSGGQCVGFTRYSAGGEKRGEFTLRGERIVARNADGTPARTVKVRYITRDNGIPDMPPELTYVDED